LPASVTESSIILLFVVLNETLLQIYLVHFMLVSTILYTIYMQIMQLDGQNDYFRSY